MIGRAGARLFGSLASKRILVTGANGQIGTALVPMLQAKCGAENVIASDLKKPLKKASGKFYILDVSQKGKYMKMVKSNKIDYILHLAAVLSASGEKNPQLCRTVNTIGFENTMEIARECGCQVFAPSSIAAFGDLCPKLDVPEDPVLLPRSMYGVTKVYNELLGIYYNKKYGVDFRCIRYPGIISSEEYEYHGTTDYSTEIFFKAIREKHYDCFLGPDTALPLIHMDDALRGTLQFIEAENTSLTRRVYNLAGMSLTPKMFADEIQKVIPEFKCEYKPDFRQAIADSWPSSLSEPSNKDWGWDFKMNIQELVAKMFSDIKANMANKK